MEKLKLNGKSVDKTLDFCEVNFFENEDYNRDDLINFRIDVSNYINKRVEELIKLNEDRKDIKAGDIVEVIDVGRIYSLYTDWLLENIDDKKILVKFAYGDSPEKDYFDIFNDIRVVKIAPHSEGDKEYEGKQLALINVGGSYYLIDVIGLRKRKVR